MPERGRESRVQKLSPAVRMGRNDERFPAQVPSDIKLNKICQNVIIEQAIAIPLVGHLKPAKQPNLPYAACWAGHLWWRGSALRGGRKWASRQLKCSTLPESAALRVSDRGSNAAIINPLPQLAHP